MKEENKEKVWKIEEVPEGDWMLLNNNRNVIYYSKNCGDVCREGKNYEIGEVTIERKFSGYIC